MARKKITNINKASKKKLSKEEVVEIAGERLFFEDFININNGEVLKEDDGKYVDEEGKEIAQEDIIVLRYNDAVNTRIRKYISEILGMRGIKNVENISNADPDVKQLYRNWEKRVGKRHIAPSEKQQQRNRFIEQVKREHRPHYMLAMFQLISWGIMYDDVFKILSDGNIDCKFEDVEIPEEYWEAEVTTENPDADLDKLLSGHKPTAIKFDKTNPLEIMIAIVTQVFEKYEALSDTVSNYMEKIYAGMQVLNSNRDFDDAGFLNTVLDDLLSGEVVEGDDA